MKTIALNSNVQFAKTEKTQPATPRGRALYTTDWFLNGKPVLSNHDNPALKVQDCNRN